MSEHEVKANVTVRAGHAVENRLTRARGKVLEVHTNLAGEFQGLEVEWHSPTYLRQRYTTAAQGDVLEMDRMLVIHTNNAR